MERDPVGLIKIFIRRFSDYWDIDYLKYNITLDIGKKELPSYMLYKLRKYFSFYADDLPFIDTFVSKYYLHAWPWYLILLCSPLLGIFTFIICEKNIRKYLFFIFISYTITVHLSCTIADDPTVRFLHSLGWMFFIFLSILITFLKKIFHSLNDFKYKNWVISMILCKFF